MQATRPKDPQEYPWSKWTDETLLSIRICNLGLRLTGSVLEARIDRVHYEPTQRGLIFQPRDYLTTEWLCPDRVPWIGIPFCPAHSRLRDLERSQILEVEGDTEHDCMKLLRHEAGHAINYAYRLYQKSRWRELFGPISEEYNVRDDFPRKYSRAFVVHLPENYAQAHPDEDFSETFATWLTPGMELGKALPGDKSDQKARIRRSPDGGNRIPGAGGRDQPQALARGTAPVHTTVLLPQEAAGPGGRLSWVIR
jgi:hypothetical protein